MTDLEIPRPNERRGHYRFFEILPLALSVSMIVLLFVLGFVNAVIASFFVLLYLFVYITRAIALAIRSLHGFSVMRRNQRLDWRMLVDELEAGAVSDHEVVRPDWHLKQLKRQSDGALNLKPSELIHAVIIATYNESREVIEPTIQSIINSNYPMDQVIFVLAYEARSGEWLERQSLELLNVYKDKFRYAVAIKHPKVEGEVHGKGGNITYAGRELQKYLEKNHIDPLRVVVTTLDADTRPDKEYLACLSYAYCVCPDPVRASFQPIAIYSNNIWDAPAPMRVLATGNSIYNLVMSMRPHALRNFSAHAQGMASLIKTDFWSVRTIVEDGHQFWRSYFAFDGRYLVYPLHLPIYQDAVLTDSYRKTLKAQFIQLRRWSYGASDIAYVVDKGFYHKNAVPKLDLIGKTLRLTEGHVGWAVAPLLTLIGGFVPVLFHSHSLVANQLPGLISQIQTYALAGGLVTIYLCLKTLPPKPERYKRHRTLFMLTQWVYLPLTTLAYNSFAAFYSQTRLAFARYMDKFDVTEKAVAGVKKN